MESESFDYGAAEAILNAKRNPFIKSGTRIDRQLFEWCRTVTFGATEIMSLFSKVTGNDKLRYLCDVQCPKCGNWRQELYGRSKIRLLVSRAKTGPPTRLDWTFDCASCLKAQREAREQAHDPHASEKFLQRERERVKEEARLRTPHSSKSTSIRKGSGKPGRKIARDSKP